MNKFGKFFRSFLCLVLLVVASNTAYCNSESDQKEEKIYVSPEQIKITDKAILVWLSDEETCLAKSLGVDDYGLYIKQLTRACRVHIGRCYHCGGCYQSDCHQRCTCYD
jgi:hypothetical protein